MMKIKLAVPDNILFDKLFNNQTFISNIGNIEIFRVTEEQCHKLLLSKQVDAALLTPIGYSLGVKKSDLRIIPATALSTVGFTGLASVFFKQGVEYFKKAASNSPEDFLIKISSILLSEKYGISIEIQKSKTEFDELLLENDLVVAWRGSKALEKGLDISDEWFDLNEMPLPLLLWVCWGDKYPENILEIVKGIADPKLQDEEIVHEVSDCHVDFDLREGRLFWTWTDEVENALEQTFQFLYFHQFIEQIGAVKLLGRD